jgi:hypothetical protein
MPSVPIPAGRRSKRIATNQRASLVINTGGNQTTLPCLIVDKSQEGFRLRSSFRLRRGQLVEIMVDDRPAEPTRCEVMWIGKTRSGHEWEVGLLSV